MHDLDLRQAILDLVRSADYRPVKPRQIAKRLGVSRDEAQEVKKTIKRLVADGELQYGSGHLVEPAGGAKPKGNRVLGVFRRREAGYGFVRPRGPTKGDVQDVYISADRAGDASTGDVVAVRLLGDRGGKHPGPRGEVVEILQRETHRFVGTYFEERGVPLVQVDGTVFARAIFVGDPDDIVPDSFGPGLPAIRDWTERHYAFSGYVTGFDPTALVDRREELRLELGYHPDERVVVVTVGGSGVGEALLRRVVASYPEARRRVSGLRMVAVAGPRIDPAALAAPVGVEVRGYVPDLYRHLAACDLAVVQGGLTTTMELTAARRPFLYFPLRNHFEQSRHVRHRLERYGAGRCMDYTSAAPEVIAAAIAEEIDRPIGYLPVAADGAMRAATLIADLV